jgi:hypothetical protein
VVNKNNNHRVVIMKRSSSVIVLIVALIVGIIAIQKVDKPNYLRGEEKVGKKVEVHTHCKHGLHNGPNGKFSSFVFCDDGMATTIGIINTQPATYVGAESEKAWKLEERFWQDKNWARDVDSYTWLEDGLKLEVETRETYGTNKKYVLDLVNRKIVSETPKVTSWK